MLRFDEFGRPPLGQLPAHLALRLGRGPPDEADEKCTESFGRVAVPVDRI
jgi:hypothetical protein